jgi:predicted RNase H-like nuclease (RuvC/YqgF family)
MSETEWTVDEALWQLRERVCCEPEDFDAVDALEARIRELEDEVERLRAENEQLLDHQCQVYTGSEVCDEVDADRDEARADVEILRIQLAAAEAEVRRLRTGA